MRKAILWGTVAAGAIAAYLMYRRGVSVGNIARESILHPVGSLMNEVQHARA
jgi:hypothetical protein